MRRFFWTIQRKFIGFLMINGIFLTLIILLVGGAAGIRIVQKFVEKHISAHLTLATQASTEMLENSRLVLSAVAGSLSQKERVILQNISLEKMSPGKISEYLLSKNDLWISPNRGQKDLDPYLRSGAALELRDFMHHQPRLVEIFTTDKYGGLVAASGITSDFYQADELWWQRSYDDGRGKNYLSDLEFDESADIHAYSMGIPIRDSKGQVVGIAKGVFDAQDIIAPITKIKIGNTGHARITDSQGRFLTQEPGAPAAVKAVPQDLLDLIRQDSQGTFRYHDEMGRDFLIGFQKISPPNLKGRDWVLVFSQEWEEYFAPFRRLFILLTSITGVILCVILGIGLFFSRSLIRPVNRLIRAIRKLSRQDFHAGLVPPEQIPQDDLGDLMLSYNDMVGALSNTTVSRNFLEVILNSTADPVFVKDRQHRWIFLNDKCCEFIGHPREKLIGKSDFEFFPREEATVFWAKDEIVFETGEMNINEEQFTDASGVTRTIITKKTLCHNARGQEMLVGVIRDVTDERRMQTDLVQTENKFRQLAENIRQVFWMTSADGHEMIYVSRAYEEIWGRSCESLYENPSDWMSHILPEEREQVARTFFEKGASGGFDMEYRIQRPDGSLRWIHDRGFPIKDDAGKAYRIAGIAEDISERKRFEAERLDISNALQNAVEGISRLTTECVFTNVNRTFADMLGYVQDELVGQSWETVFLIADYPKLRKAFEQIRTKPKVELEIKARRKDGSAFDSVTVFVPSTQIGADTPGFFCFMKDVTERKFREALEVKYDFVRMVSHEVRTPLHAIKEGIGVMLEGLIGNISEAQKEVLSITKANVDRLTRLINNSLDYQKLEAGAFSFDLGEHDLNTVVDEVGRTVEALINNKKLELELHLASPAPLIAFDRDRIFQVVLNLVHNAIKFTDKGKITVATAPVKDGFRVSIEDTGIGMSEQDIAKIFKTFGQLEAGRELYPGGSGLGLAISRKIIEYHGGKIWAEPCAVQGSRFSFTLPLRPAVPLQSGKATV